MTPAVRALGGVPSLELLQHNGWDSAKAEVLAKFASREGSAGDA